MPGLQVYFFLEFHANMYMVGKIGSKDTENENVKSMYMYA